MKRLAYQRTKDDCVRCSLATLLSTRYDDVPDFWKKYRKAETQIRGIAKWLASRGLALVPIHPSRKPDCLYLAAGKAKRGFYHMVVMRGGKLVHDPHLDGSGLRTVRWAWVVVPEDVGDCRVW